MKLERVVLCHYAEARAEWRKYLFMDVYDDRDVRERVERERAEQSGAGNSDAARAGNSMLSCDALR